MRSGPADPGMPAAGGRVALRSRGVALPKPRFPLPGAPRLPDLQRPDLRLPGLRLLARARFTLLLLSLALLASGCVGEDARGAAGSGAEDGALTAAAPCPPASVCPDDPFAEVAARVRSGDLDGAESLLLAKIEEARAARDPRAEADFLARRAALVARRDGLLPALATLEAAVALLPPDDPLRQAEFACLEGSLRAGASDPGGYAAARRGLDFLGVDPLDPELLARPIETLPVVARCLFAAGQQRAQSARVHGYEALAYLEAAARIQGHLGDDAARAASLQWAGGTLRNMANYEGGLALLAEAYEVAVAAGVPGVAAWALHGRAGALADLGQPREAALEAARSREMMERAGDAVGIGWSHRLAVDLALADRDPALAREHLEAFLRIQGSLGHAVPELDVAPLRLRMARVEGDTARILAAVDRFHTLSDGGRLRPAAALPRLSMAAALLQVGSVDRAAALLREPSLPEGSSWIALWTWHARLAEVAALEGELDTAEAELEEALRWLAALRNRVFEGDLRYGVQALAATDLTDPDLGVATVLARLAEGGRLHRAFRFASELRARDLERERLRTLALAPAPVRAEAPGRVGGDPGLVEQVQAALAPDEAMVLFVTGRGDEPTTRFLVRRDRILARLLPPVDEIEPLVDRMVASLAAGEAATSLRERVGEMLLEGLTEEAGAAVHRLLVVPDQGLHRIPFDALFLPLDEGGSLVLARYEIGWVPSPQLLIDLRWRSPNPAGTPSGAKGVLALGYGGPARATDGESLPRLRWAEPEARRAARAIPGSAARTGVRATSEAVLEAREGGYQVLHVAGHARVDADLPGRTALYLAPIRGASGKDPSGFVSMAWIEARSLPFSLVVLSACGTTGGVETRGEGLAGPARSFLAAGSRAVVGSGWAVADRATLRQMEYFYEALARGENAGAALTFMKREALRLGRPPGEWAAFQLHGDPAVRIRTPGAGPAGRRPAGA